MTEDKLKALMGKFKSVRIAVFGDFFVDKILLIDNRLDEPSVETCLTAYQIVEKRIEPGAAGTVVNNLSALGVGTLHAIGVAGQDGEGYELQSRLDAKGVEHSRIIHAGDWFTPTYIKPMFMRPEGLEESNRLDIRNRKAPLSREVERALIDNLEAMAGSLDALIVLDQLSPDECGVITPAVREALTGIARSHPKLIAYADSRFRPRDFEHFVVKCNHTEAIRMIFPGKDDNGADEALLELCARGIREGTHRDVIVTWGSKGMGVLSGEQFRLVPTVKVQGKIDICGAGDSATAGLVSALCAGADAFEAAVMGNLAASVTIRQIGRTGVATQPEILESWRHYEKGEAV